MLEPTMELDLKGCYNDYMIEYNILHQFGHALGLCHENQHPDYLEVMSDFLDVKAILDFHRIKKISTYLEHFGKLEFIVAKTDYDVHSIMHLP